MVMYCIRWSPYFNSVRINATLTCVWFVNMNCQWIWLLHLFINQIRQIVALVRLLAMHMADKEPSLIIQQVHN